MQDTRVQQDLVGIMYDRMKHVLFCYHSEVAELRLLSKMLRGIHHRYLMHMLHFHYNCSQTLLPHRLRTCYTLSL